MSGKEHHRYPDRGRRRPGPELSDQIRGVPRKRNGKDVVGIRKGWKGLTNVDTAEMGESIYHRELTRDNTRTIDRTGGTILHTSRTNPSRVAASKVPAHISKDRLKSLPFDGKNYDFTSIVIENLEKLGIGCLVAIGGDDTLGFAATLSRNGFPVIGVPKTMDNDVAGTEYCIGFSTAITRAKDAITRQRTTLGSHERIGIFRIFGRDARFHRFVHGVCDRSTLPDSRISFRYGHVSGIAAGRQAPQRK